STSRLLLSFLSPRSRAHRHLHSFPTRRSSDLWRRNCCTRQEHRSRSSSSSPRATRCASTPCGSRSTANLLRTTSTAPKSSRPCARAACNGSTSATSRPGITSWKCLSTASSRAARPSAARQRLDTELAQYHVLDEPKLDTLHYHINNAEFSVGDFELDYRMHQRAGRAIKAVLEGAVDEAVRNEAAFRLARIHFQKGQLDDALQALARIKGTVPEEIKGDLEFL